MPETEAKSKIKFLADECTFVQTVDLMRELKCEVHRIQELGMNGVSDPVVFRKAQEMGAVLVTNDKGFGDVRDFPPSSHHGVIVLRMLPKPEAVQAVHRVLRGLIEIEKKFEGILFTVDTHKYRRRKRP